MPLTGNWAPPDPGDVNYDDQPHMRDLVGRTLALVGPGPRETLEVKGEARDRVRLEFLVVLDNEGAHQAYEDYAIWQARVIRQLETARRAGQPGMIGKLEYPPGGAYEIVPANPKAEERAKQVLEDNGWVPTRMAERPESARREQSYSEVKKVVDDGGF